MRSATLRLMLSLTFVALVAPLVLADPYPQEGQCDSNGQIALHRIEIDAAAAIVYVDDENYLLGNGVWVYQESNGVWQDPGPGVAHFEGLSNANLQRGGGSLFVPGDGDVCVDEVPNGPDAGPLDQPLT